jgi:hypothetical protein
MSKIDELLRELEVCDELFDQYHEEKKQLLIKYGNLEDTQIRKKIQKEIIKLGIENIPRLIQEVWDCKIKPEDLYGPSYEIEHDLWVEEKRYRYKIAEIIGMFGEETLPLLISLKNDENEFIRSQIVPYALKVMGTNSSKEIIVSMIDSLIDSAHDLDKNMTYRGVSGRVLAEAVPLEAFPILLDRFHNGDENEKEVVLVILSIFNQSHPLYVNSKENTVELNKGIGNLLFNFLSESKLDLIESTDYKKLYSSLFWAIFYCNMDDCYSIVLELSNYDNCFKLYGDILSMIKENIKKKNKNKFDILHNHLAYELEWNRPTEEFWVNKKVRFRTEYDFKWLEDTFSMMMIDSVGSISLFFESMKEYIYSFKNKSNWEGKYFAGWHPRGNYRLSDIFVALNNSIDMFPILIENLNPTEENFDCYFHNSLHLSILHFFSRVSDSKRVKVVENHYPYMVNICEKYYHQNEDGDQVLENPEIFQYFSNPSCHGPLIARTLGYLMSCDIQDKCLGQSMGPIPNRNLPWIGTVYNTDTPIDIIIPFLNDLDKNLKEMGILLLMWTDGVRIEEWLPILFDILDSEIRSNCFAKICQSIFNTFNGNIELKLFSEIIDKILVTNTFSDFPNEGAEYTVKIWKERIMQARGVFNVQSCRMS